MTRSGLVGSAVLILGIGAAAWAGLVGGRGGSNRAVAQAAPQLTLYTAPTVVDTSALEGPRQPIFFRHDIHAGQYEINCLYCHTYAAESPSPGVPSMQTCRGCHLLVRGADSASQAEIAKVNAAWDEGRAIEWVRVHSVPQHARFPHMRHIKALGTEACTRCHGNVREMPQIYQFASLKMGWCITCHLENAAARDCAACHY